MSNPALVIPQGVGDKRLSFAISVRIPEGVYIRQTIKK